MKKPTILIVGHGRHGKDTLAEMITKELGHKFRGSSQVAASEVIYPLMRNFYDSPEDAFEKRHQNRQLWASLIRDFNRDDKSRLAKLVCEGGYGYTGLRELEEVKKCIEMGVFTHVIWISRSVLPENDPTMTFKFHDLFMLKRCLHNFKLTTVVNSSLTELREKVKTDIKEFLS